MLRLHNFNQIVRFTYMISKLILNEKWIFFADFSKPLKQCAAVRRNRDLFVKSGSGMIVAVHGKRKKLISRRTMLGRELRSALLRRMAILHFQSYVDFGYNFQKQIIINSQLLNKYHTLGLCQLVLSFVHRRYETFLQPFCKDCQLENKKIY